MHILYFPLLHGCNQQMVIFIIHYCCFLESVPKKQQQQQQTKKPWDPWHCHTHQVITALYHYLKIKDWNTGWQKSGHWTKTQVPHPVSSRNYTPITDLAGCQLICHEPTPTMNRERERELLPNILSLKSDLPRPHPVTTFIQWLVFQSSMKNTTCAQQQNISQAKTGPDTIKW